MNVPEFEIMAANYNIFCIVPYHIFKATGLIPCKHAAQLGAISLYSCFGKRACGPLYFVVHTLKVILRVLPYCETPNILAHEPVCVCVYELVAEVHGWEPEVQCLDEADMTVAI